MISDHGECTDRSAVRLQQASPGQSASPIQSAAKRAGATLAVAGQLIIGEDPDAIRVYLFPNTCLSGSVLSVRSVSAFQF
jgi:hypothetical protein